MDSTSDASILRTISSLVEDEHALRAQAAQGTLDQETERQRLAELEQALDQCWDLLRQRRARQEFGQDAGEAAARPVPQVEGYLQ